MAGTPFRLSGGRPLYKFYFVSETILYRPRRHQWPAGTGVTLPERRLLLQEVLRSPRYCPLLPAQSLHEFDGISQVLWGELVPESGHLSFAVLNRSPDVFIRERGHSVRIGQFLYPQSLAELSISIAIQPVAHSAGPAIDIFSSCGIPLWQLNLLRLIASAAPDQQACKDDTTDSAELAEH